MPRKLSPKERDYYGRNLPHWQPENAVFKHNYIHPDFLKFVDEK